MQAEVRRAREILPQQAIGVLPGSSLPRTVGVAEVHSGQIFLSQALDGEDIGLEEVQDRVWNILYYDTLLGRFDERTKEITGAPSIRGKC